MATIVRDKIKQPDGKDFKLLDAIDVEYSYTNTDGLEATVSVKERLDDITSSEVRITTLEYEMDQLVEATSAEIQGLFD